jgi:hypothetical protein
MRWGKGREGKGGGVEGVFDAAFAEEALTKKVESGEWCERGLRRSTGDERYTEILYTRQVHSW